MTSAIDKKIIIPGSGSIERTIDDENENYYIVKSELPEVWTDWYFPKNRVKLLSDEYKKECLKDERIHKFPAYSRLKEYYESGDDVYIMDWKFMHESRVNPVRRKESL